MLKNRLIPVLLLKNGFLVRSEDFSIHQIIGNPIHEVERFNEWNVDELIYLDITRKGDYDQRRSDTKINSLENPLEILDAVSKTCFMPLTWGGRIKTVDDMREHFSRGADKITINSEAVNNPSIIRESSQIFGSQAIVVCIDALRHPNGKYEVMINGKGTQTGKNPADWAKEVEKLGAGEILLQSVDRDGTGKGYDLELIKSVATNTTIPVIALGGVGLFDHYALAIEAGASAAAAANIWHFKELTDLEGKRAMARSGINVRM